MRRVLIATALCVAASWPAAAIEVKFETWCLEEAGYPQARCDQERADDVAEFKVYRDRVESVEMEYRLKREREEELRRRVDTQGDTTPGTTRDGVRE